VPREMCQRPSWTHLTESAAEGPSDVPEGLVDVGDAAPADPTAARQTLIVQPSEDHGHAEVVVGLSDKPHDDSQAERMAAINFLRDFHNTPAPIPEAEVPETQVDLLSLDKSPARRRDPQIHLQEQPRYLKLWAVEERDLGAPSSVWKSTAKKGATSSQTSLKNSSSPPPTVRIMQVKTIADTAFGAVDFRRAVEAARSDTQHPAFEEDPQSVSGALVEVAPVARGVNSLLRTSLRYALQF